MKTPKEQSVINLNNILDKALCCNDGKYNWLIVSCGNQSSLSKINRKSDDIIPMSLNTLKNHADKLIHGGFNAMDNKRKKLKGLKTTKKKSEKGTLKKNNKSLKDELNKAIRMRAILIKAYNDLNRITLDTLSNNPAYQYDYDQHRKLYSDYFGIKLVIDNEE